MDLDFLDKSNMVTPLLVRLYDSHKLYGLAQDKKPLARAELTTAVTDLLGMNLSARESELIADVLIALMRQAELDLRQALAERLSVMDNVPLRLILQMANDDISVADPVLRQSKVLGDLDLIYIIKSKTPEYWRSMAKRSAMSEQVMNLLADTKDFETALNLAENKAICLSDHALSVLSDLAQKRENIAVPLLRREEMTRDLASRLYQFVGQELKKFILENYDLDSQVLMDAIDEIVVDLVEAPVIEEFQPESSMVKSAERFREKGLLTPNLMIGALKRGQTQAFVAQFAAFTGLGIETVTELLMQQSGQGLAIACKAFGIVKADFVSIFLLTNRVRNKGRMIDMKDMTRAIQYFEQIKEDVAKDIMKNSLLKKV